MSLLPDLSQSKDKRKKTHQSAQEEELDERRIQHPSELLDMVRDTVGSFQINDEERRAASKKGSPYRTRDRWEIATLADVQGNVSPRIWENMVRSMLAGMKKSIAHSQSNGDWKVMDFETDIIRDAKGLEHIAVGVRWVDMLNEQDLEYRGGHPVSLNINVQGNAIPEEILAALASRETGDPELKAMLAQLIGLMAQREQRESKDTEAPESYFPQSR